MNKAIVPIAILAGLLLIVEGTLIQKHGASTCFSTISDNRTWD